jgi:hypothetical protein
VEGEGLSIGHLAVTTAPPRQRSHCSPQSSMQSLPCPSWLRVALPMVGPLLLRWHSAPMRSGSLSSESALSASQRRRPRGLRGGLLVYGAAVLVASRAWAVAAKLAQPRLSLLSSWSSVSQRAPADQGCSPRTRQPLGGGLPMRQGRAAPSPLEPSVEAAPAACGAARAGHAKKPLSDSPDPIAGHSAATPMASHGDRARAASGAPARQLLNCRKSAPLSIMRR